MKVKTKSVEETEKVANEFVKRVLIQTPLIWQSDSDALKNAFVIAMYGDLGSGKTTFVKAVAKTFGIEETVTSPTFVIEKIYRLTNQLFENLIHIDAYRLKSGTELKHLGWEEIYKNPKNIIFIEWPDNVKDILSKNIQKISFNFINENTREIYMDRY